MQANELGDKAPTIDADVKDGVIRILFRHDCLGYNCSSLGELQISKFLRAKADSESQVTA